MSAMSDFHQECCTAIEETMCAALDMDYCERTYEIAVDILEAIKKVELDWGINKV